MFPDWVRHAFLKDLPICDDQGFVRTDLLMRNPVHRNVFAVGGFVSISVPKLAGIAHEEAGVAARQIAADLGRIPKADAAQPVHLTVFCIGDTGDGQAFYIDSDSWYGGHKEELRVGRIPFFLKTQHNDMFFRKDGKAPAWGLETAILLGEHLALKPQRAQRQTGFAHTGSRKRRTPYAAVVGVSLRARRFANVPTVLWDHRPAVIVPAEPPRSRAR